MSTKKQKKIVKKVAPKAAPRKEGHDASVDYNLILNRTNYIFFGIGFLLILVGLLLMSGGGFSDYNTFDPDHIYSFRRITLAPFVIILGLIVTVFGIFKK